MESVIEFALQKLTIKRDQAEVNLKNKRLTFDQQLNRHEKLLITLKKRDPALLTMEEMEDAVTFRNYHLVLFLQIPFLRWKQLKI